MGFTVHRGPAPDRAALAAHLRVLASRRQRLQGELAAAEAADAANTAAALEHQLMLNATQQQQARAQGVWCGAVAGRPDARVCQRAVAGPQAASEAPAG